MWMATIDVRKVAEPLRDKLMAYQVEAADVLARHFLGEQPKASVPALPEPGMLDTQLAQAKLVVAILERQAEQDRRLAVLESESSTTRELVALAVERADAAIAYASGDTGYVTVVGFCNLRRLRLSRAEMANAGREATKLCEAKGIPVKRVSSEVWGTVNAYPVDVLDQWLSR